MNTLNHLNKIIKRLKDHELNTLGIYLNAFKMEHINEGSQSANLVELLQDEKQPKVPEVLQFKLYGKPNMPAFTRLVSRTREKVYESLLLEYNLKKDQTHAERNRVGYNLRKKLIEAEILASRGLGDDNEHLYEFMFKKAVSYEFYDVVLEVLYNKHTFAAFRYGARKIRKIELEIVKYENIRNLVNRARIIFDKFVARINFAAAPEDYLEELPTMIQILRKDFMSIKSPTIGYCLYFIETEHYQQKGNYNQARKTLQEMVNLLTRNVSVRTRNRLGTVYGNLGNNELLMHNFDDGLKYIKQSYPYFKESPINLNVVKEVEFLLQLFQGNAIEAEKIIEELYVSSAKQKASFLFYKRTYLYACLKNLQGDYKKSEELLNEVKEIEKDKEGWNIGIRLLQIMNLIDRGKNELIESNVQNLKKYLTRLKGQSQARKRYSVILRILSRLMNDNYQFRKTYKRSNKYFDMLASGDERYAWSVKGPEVIVFHEWFVSRMELRKYSYANLFKS